MPHCPIKEQVQRVMGANKAKDISQRGCGPRARARLPSRSECTELKPGLLSNTTQCSEPLCRSSLGLESTGLGGRGRMLRFGLHKITGRHQDREVD